MHTLYLVSVWLHILAAMTWLGGMLFLVTVLVPMLRRPEMRARAVEMFHAIGVRFRLVGWIALATLVVTGVLNVMFRGYRLSDLFDGTAYAGPWGHTLAAKLAFVALVLTFGAVHDFWLGPAATRLARENAPPEQRERYRRGASLLGRASLLLALVIVALAVKLVRG